MGYPLQPLLLVRRLRENSAKAARAAAEHLVREAERQVAERKSELERYKIWLLQEVDSRYAQIMGRSMHLHDLDQFKAGIAELDAGTVLRQEQVIEAEKALAESLVKLNAAKELLLHARKETMKIDTHKNLWVEQAKQEAERREDIEMEEFTPRHPLGSPGEEGEF